MTIPVFFILARIGGGVVNNINRELLSVQNGLKQAKTKYTMKLRTDFILTGAVFLKYFNAFNNFLSDKKLKLFKNRIISIDFENNLLFRLGDFFSFGYTADLKKLWDIPLATKNEMENWIFSDNTNYLINEICRRSRYITEQYILIHCVAKNIPEVFDICKDYTDISDNGRELSEKIFANNFIILGTRRIGIRPLKKRLRFCCSINYFYDWLMLYKKYIDPRYKICMRDLNFSKAFNLEKDIAKLKKYCKFFLKPFEKTIKWIFSPLRIILLIIKMFLDGTRQWLKR